MTVADIEAIVGGYHGDAFRVLGPHIVQKRDAQPHWEVRTFLPQADSAEVVIGETVVPMAKRHKEGLFVAQLDGEQQTYRIRAFLRGGGPDDFSLIVGETAILSEIKYVITLDTDTQLPRDAARQFIGAMAHPLNTPRFDEPDNSASRGIVTSGHGILQPRVSVSLPGTNRSRYARLYGGQPGLDQYTRTVSDVYQDLFDEGSFIGKGIYDVDAVERALKGRLPADRILSHDLLEGCYVRAGLLSDVELFEEYPPRYSADVARRRRWIRGDWQLVGWLRRRVKAHDGSSERNPLSMLSQWKLLDNLRRSLVPAALTALLLLGWTVRGIMRAFVPRR